MVRSRQLSLCKCGHPRGRHGNKKCFKCDGCHGFREKYATKDLGNFGVPNSPVAQWTRECRVCERPLTTKTQRRKGICKGCAVATQAQFK